jgi:hypothetical protein
MAGPYLVVAGSMFFCTTKLLVEIGGDIHTFGDELPEDTVQVLVAAALPRRVRMGEEHRQTGGSDVGVPGHLGAAVPGQRAAGLLGQATSGGDQR